MTINTRSLRYILIVFVFGAMAGMALLDWKAPRSDPHRKQLAAAHRERCEALREQALIIAMARYVGLPIGAINDDKAEGNLSESLVEEIYARPDWLPLVAAREIKARCLAQVPR